MNLLWDRLRSSLWPIPLLMLLASLLLIQLTRMADAHLSGDAALQAWWLHSGNGDDARNLLSTLATAVITIASLVFSITIVALTLAANQFGSRLVRAYMTDTRTKLSLGFFLLTIVYCLLGLRLVSVEMAPGEVPHVTVTTGLALSIACVLVLLFFLHMAAKAIVADEVIRRVARDLDGSIDALPPAGSDDAPLAGAAALLPPEFERGSALLRSPKEGYVEEIAYERLAAFAAQHDLVLRLDIAAGDYVCRDGWLGRAFPANRCPGELDAAVAEAVVIGAERTPVQDLAYSVRHLVDVALRALSPGINDANTALVVIDRLRGALSRLLGRSLPSGIFRDEGGRCRLVARRRTLAELMAAALRPVRDAASRQPLVIVAMLQALDKVAEHASQPEHFEAIAQEARLITEAAFVHDMPASEEEAIQEAALRLRAKLERVRGDVAHGKGPGN